MSHEELLWKFAEGKCSPAEKTAVEKLLAEKPAVKAELNLIQEVQSALSGMEADGPSMRFAQNVMGNLPAKLYPPLSAGSLVGPFWKKTFWAGTALTAVAAVVAGLKSGPSDTSLPYAGQAIEEVSGIFGQLPAVSVQFFTLTIITLLTLILADKLFHKGAV